MMMMICNRSGGARTKWCVDTVCCCPGETDARESAEEPNEDQEDAEVHLVGCRDSKHSTESYPV
jgi:hypothetical protein